MDYQNTKIYKIISHQGDKVYIGSTTKKTLAMRIEIIKTEIWSEFSAIEFDF